jgi:hypothetical protein
MTLEPAKVLNPESKRAHIGRGIAVAIRSHGQVFTVEHEINGNALICDLRALPRDAIAIGRMIGRDDDPMVGVHPDRSYGQGLPPSLPTNSAPGQHPHR